MLDIGLQCRMGPAFEDTAPFQRGQRRLAIGPVAAAAGGLTGQGVTLMQADQGCRPHHTDHASAEQYRVEQHGTGEQLRLTAQDQPRKHATKAVAYGKPLYVAILATSALKGLHRQGSGAVPAAKHPTMVTVPMALNVAKPQVEMLAQAHQQRLVSQTTEAVAMQEVQQRFATGRGSPATQGETFGAFVGPGNQLHRLTVLSGSGKR